MPELTEATFKHKSLKDCPVRFIKKSYNSNKGVVCEPSGGIPLASFKGDFDFLIDACSNCQIPEELKTEKKRCIYLVYVRLWENKYFTTYYSCRWFYNLNPNLRFTEIWKQCGGCSYWYPRPDDELTMTGREKWVKKVLKLYIEGEETSRFPSFKPPPTYKKPAFSRFFNFVKK